MSVINVDPRTLALHEIASEHPLMTEVQLRSLTIDIDLNGQLEPIKLYRKKVVDGRHRLKAILSLGNENIKCVELPNNMTKDEVRGLVSSTENRRHQSVSQRACQAYLEILNGDVEKTTQKAQAEKYGISETWMSKCKHVAGSYGIDILRQLRDGKKVSVLVNGRFDSYNCVNRLYLDSKRKVDNEKRRKPLSSLLINYAAEDVEVNSLISRKDRPELEYFLKRLIECMEVGL